VDVNGCVVSSSGIAATGSVSEVFAFKRLTKGNRDVLDEGVFP